ncbi:hypothetical protein niasHT_026902 [Heterodera trifolii]|uniref:Effector protein n=1 Tax=Heterodera trifolii TaxID=157864 RepID=A0ABD2JY27_9BILA
MFRFDLRLLPLLLFTLCAFRLNNANSALKTALNVNVPPSNIKGNDTDNDEDIANPTITQIEPNQNGEEQDENDEPPPQTDAPDDEKDNDEEDDADSEAINQKVLSAQIVPPLDNVNSNDEENENANANANALAEEPNGDEKLTQTTEDHDEEEPSDSELVQSNVNGEDSTNSTPAKIIQNDDDDGNGGDNDDGNSNGNDGNNGNGGAF